MGTRGRFKGWKSPKAIAAMTPAEKAEYDALVARVKAERDAEKIAKGINPNAQEELKAKREEKVINLQNLINSQLEYQATHIMSQEEDETEQNGKPWYKEIDSENDRKETNINHLSGEGFCIIETNEDFWIRKISEMIEKTPDKVIVLDNWSNGDMIRVKIPYSAMKKIKTQARVVSEEQRQRMSELGKVVGKRRGRPKKVVEVNTPETTEDVVAESVTEDTNEIPATSEITTETTINLGVVEESDEEFEGTPMNRFREVEETNEDELSENEVLTGVEDEDTEEVAEGTEEVTEEKEIPETEEDGFTFCNSTSLSFGKEICLCRCKDEDRYGTNYEEEG